MDENMKLETIDPNVQAARVAGRRAELGWMEVEFIMYGCAYLEKGKVYYKVSSRAEDIYRFTESAAVEKIYTSNVLRYSEKCAVPSGMKDLIANDVKKDLARELKQRYPAEFFVVLNEMAECTERHHGAELLWQETEELEGVFSEEKLDRFEAMVQYAYIHHGIDGITYKNLMKWIQEEKKNMYDNLVSKDNYEKTVYGFIYEKNGQKKCVDNGLLSYVYEKAEQLEQEGYLITPILSHTYWSEQPRRIPEVMNEFRKLMLDVYDNEYMKKLKEIRSNKVNIKEREFKKLLKDVERRYGEYAAKTILRYGYVWGVLQLNEQIK